MSVSRGSSSSADSSTSPTLSDRLWTVVEPVFYYVLVAYDGFAQLSGRVRLAICITTVLAIAGGVVLQAATHPPVSAPLESAPPVESSPPVGDRGASTVRADALGAGLAPVATSREPASIQDGVFLTLRRNVRAPGTRAYAGDLLPAGTITVVYQEPGSEPHTLSNQGFTVHRELMTQIIRSHTGAAPPHRKGSVSVDTLTGLGQTRSRYTRTGTPTTNPARFSAITYVAAKMPNGEMYESYVNTGEDGFFVGFDAVVSGRMTMGPVADEHASGMRKMFDVLSVPSVNLPDLAGAVAQAMTSGGFPALVGKTRGSTGDVKAPTPSPVASPAGLEEPPATYEASDPATVAAFGPSERVIVSQDRSQNTDGEQEPRQDAPVAVPNAPSAEQSGAGQSGAGQSGAERFSTLTGEPGLLATFGEDAEVTDVQPAASQRLAKTEALPPAALVAEGASTSTSGMSGWWVVVALIAGMAAGGAGSYIYWRRQVELEQDRLTRLRDAYREEQAARKAESAGRLMSDPSAGTVAPGFELGDDFWESSTLKPPPKVDKQKALPDKKKDDEEWLDNLPF